MDKETYAYVAERVGHNIADVLPAIRKRSARIEVIATLVDEYPRMVEALVVALGDVPESLLEQCGAFKEQMGGGKVNE